MITDKKIKELKEKIDLLKKKDIDLIIADLDDTIFSTKELIDNDYRKWRRWKEWNKFILKNNLIPKIIKEVYLKDFPKIISSKLRINHDLILTAGVEQFQIEKIKAIKLEHINLKVVDDAEKKILAAIEYITDILGFIPNKITVYEDRPKYFIEYKNLLEKTIWTKVEIMFVEMNGNESEPNIKKIETL